MHAITHAASYCTAADYSRDTRICTACTILIHQHFHHNVRPKPPEWRNVGFSTLWVSVSALTASSCRFSARLTAFIDIKSRIMLIFRELKFLTSEILNVLTSTVCPVGLHCQWSKRIHLPVWPYRIIVSEVEMNFHNCVPMKGCNVSGQEGFTSLCDPTGL
jgi:hypothetical protein